MKRKSRTSPATRKKKLTVVDRTRQALLEGVGAEIASSFPGLTRLGGQIVVAMYLDDGPRSMDELAAELGRSKSNIFVNLRALEGAGIVERRRESGTRKDAFALRGPYPDVVIGAYLERLRRVVSDKHGLVQRALVSVADTKAAGAEQLRGKLQELGRKYTLFAAIARMLPSLDGPIDVEAALSRLPPQLLAQLVDALSSARPPR